MKISKLSIAILSALVVGCSSNDNQSELKEIDQLKIEQERLREMVNQQFELDRSHMDESDDIYVLGSPFEIKEDVAVPPIFDMPVSIGNLEKEPLDSVLEKINRKFQQFGVIVAVERDAHEYLIQQASIGDESDEESDSGSADDIAGILPIQNIDSEAIAEKDTGKYGAELSLNFKDTTLRNMLDLISASTGLWWGYEEGRITLNYFVKETFQIDVSEASYAIASSQASQSNSDTGSADFSLSTSSEQSNPLTQLENQLGQYLSVDGSIALNRFDRTVTIKDTPSNVKRAKYFIEDFNYRALTPYNIKTDIYEIIYEVNDEKNIDWTIAFEDANWAVDALVPKVVSESGLGGLTAKKIGGKFDGSTAMLKFLNENSSVFSRITNTVKTKNNIPTQLVSSNNQAIVAGREVTIDSNGFSQESTTTKLINEGFNLSSRPRLTSTGSIDMELILNTKAINNISAFGDEENMVQLEETGQHGTITGIPIRSGETVVLNAYERDLSSAQITSLAEQMPWWTGGGNTKKRYKAALIVMVRADIMGR
ncbi:hypothetical protein [Vibrio sp. R78045]|uniref:hypothetical protein n=1 Tax=Vibrio sp. R78045 TaxID=3093868 RepID=UPI0036F1D21C